MENILLIQLARYLKSKFEERKRKKYISFFLFFSKFRYVKIIYISQHYQKTSLKMKCIVKYEKLDGVKQKKKNQPIS